MKEVIIGVTTMGVFGVLSWMAVTLITLDKRTEVMSVKIQQNNDMLKPLWEDFIRRSASYDNKEIKYGEASVKVWK
tara:strand:+ start:181 stop:408 length:228 start_codon:yes stop_codon:yes gene_type:complete